LTEAARRTADLPLYTLRRIATGEIATLDVSSTSTRADSISVSLRRNDRTFLRLSRCSDENVNEFVEAFSREPSPGFIDVAEAVSFFARVVLVKDECERLSAVLTDPEIDR
jgi:hypothetical protein